MTHNTSHPSASGGNSQVDVAEMQREEWEFVPVSLTNGLLEAVNFLRGRVRFLEAEKPIWSLEKERLLEEVEHLKTELQHEKQRSQDLQDERAEWMSSVVISENGDMVSREDLWASRADEE